MRIEKPKYSAETDYTGCLEWAPELRFTPMGDSLCSFALVVGRETIHCELWGERGENLVEINPSPGTELHITGHWRYYHTKAEPGKEFKRFTVGTIRFTGGHYSNGVITGRRPQATTETGGEAQ